MKRIGTMTLGCKVNHTETQGIEGLFEEAGYQVVPFESEAEIYLINTCSVTHLGERKSRQMIRRAIRNNPEATVVATGCYAQSAPGEISGIAGVDLIIGTQDRQHIVKWVEEQRKIKIQQIHVRDISMANLFEDIPAHEEGRTRAFLKVQEGCNQFCTYCIIPYTRGPLRSRLPESVQQEAKKLFEQGFQEIILTGIHLGAYGLDLSDRPGLADLIKKILEVSDNGRIRLGSLESIEVSPELVELLEKNSHICQHLHLPLQSGSEAILKSMGRPYSLEKFERLLTEIRNRLPNIAITTDIIVGFPGETEESFVETLKTVKDFNFSGIHVFPFSPRRGTPAEKFPDPVSEETKKERVKKISELAASSSRSFHHLFIGREVEVLWEEADKSGALISGWSSEYIRIYGESTIFEAGKIDRVQITKIFREGLWAEKRRSTECTNSEK